MKSNISVREVEHLRAPSWIPVYSSKYTFLLKESCGARVWAVRGVLAHTPTRLNHEQLSITMFQILIYELIL